MLHVNKQMALNVKICASLLFDVLSSPDVDSERVNELMFLLLESLDNILV